MLEALTIIKEQTDKFEVLVEQLEQQMNDGVFYDRGDVQICERLLSDHKEYLMSLQHKYSLVQSLYKEKAN